MEKRSEILVVGAREHNLKNITVSIPKDSLTVITGPSGSGKSSLAFDVLYAEGQRRYLESLSSYARQFLGMPPKAQCDRIDGLCPAIAIDQKTVGSNPRSTVGTITEIYDYLRVLYARIGDQSCPTCKVPVTACTAQQILMMVEQKFSGLSVQVLAPIAHRRKGTFVQELADAALLGVRRFIVDGMRVSVSSADDALSLNLAKNHQHTIDGIIDMVEIKPHDSDERARLLEAIERACKVGGGFCKIMVGAEEYLYSTASACIGCGGSFSELEPRLFSFNSPIGACKECHGLGLTFLGECEWFAQEKTCLRCQGRRLNERALAVHVGGKNIHELSSMSIKQLLVFFEHISCSDEKRVIAQNLFDEICYRLHFLLDVGLGYLSLGREARSLSGGEGQRIRLARQLGASLCGVLYILDEPSIGLHQRDNDKLIGTLKKLRDLGNTVLVVEHDHDTMAIADYLIDMGPAAGVNGGNVVAVGTPAQISANPVSLTGQYLSGHRVIKRASPLRKPQGFLTLCNATTNNLKNITVKIPLGVLACVSGVSGSGKSSLIMDDLVPAVHEAFESRHEVVKNPRLLGAEQLAAMVVIDQSPIGRTSRSNPATYIGVFDDIRQLFSSLPESNVRGYGPGRFSFNVQGGGRCEACRGDGSITVSMHFLPDVTVACKACGGARFNAQTLEITYKGKSIADILAMTAREAVDFFAHHGTIKRRLQLLCDVGLDYLTLGQPAPTLSGGEAQRIKLVNELAKRGNKTLYILDEPTTGLHACDIEKLLAVFERLIDKGNSLLVIEHNLDVLKTADYLIDLGPEGGDEGGAVVVAGEPLVVASCQASHTGRYLKRVL